MKILRQLMKLCKLHKRLWNLKSKWHKNLMKRINNSSKTKLEYIKYGHLKKYCFFYLISLINNYIATIENAFDKEHLKLLISIINSFIISKYIFTNSSPN